MRVIECNECGETVSAANDDELHLLARIALTQRPEELLHGTEGLPAEAHDHVALPHSGPLGGASGLE